MAFDEEPQFYSPRASLRRWKVCTVISKVVAERPTITLVTEHGSLTLTPDHKLLFSRKHGRFRWDVAANTVCGKIRQSWLSFTFAPWDEKLDEASRELGVLAGFFAGEGHLTVHRRGDTDQVAKIGLGFTQNAGPLAESMKARLAKFGWRVALHSQSRSKGVICERIRVLGAAKEIFRFLGRVRPERLLPKLDKVLETAPPKIRFVPTPLLAKLDGGTKRVVDIQTTSGTFIAEGFAVHNCGPAGTLLNRGLKAAGLVREECVVTNLVNKKPPHDEWRLHAPGDVARGLAELDALCRREQPALIVAFGAEALHALAFGDPDAAVHRVTESRGYTFDSPHGPVLSTVHPAFCLRQWHPWYALFSLDLKKAARLYEETRDGGWGGVARARADYGESIWTDPANVFWPTKGSTEPIAVDIETNADLSIACIGWAGDCREGNCAPFTDAFRSFFRGLLASENPKVFQNGAFDVTILERHGLEVRNWRHDTMILWSCLEPLLSGKVTLGENGDGGAKQTHKSLRFLASVWTDEPWWKSYAFESDMDKYRLCAKDSRVTLEIFEKMEKVLYANP